MKALALQLWKEWRDHRAAFVGLWILLAVAAAGIAALAGSREMIAGGRIVEILSFGALLYGLVVVVPELIPSEGARGTLAFLQRLPGGLARVFWTKSLFAVLAVVAAAGSGYVIASAARALSVPETIHSPMVLTSGAALQLAELGLAAVFWILAVSCWVPRGLLAVPAVGLLGGGWWLWIATHPYVLKLHRPEWQLHLLLAAGFLAAWVSFVPGRSFGRGVLGAAARGGSVALLALAPIPVSLWRWHEEWSDPLPPGGTDIVSASLGADMRLLFLNLRRGSEWPSHATILDLASGSLRRFGEPGGAFAPLWSLEVGIGGEAGAHGLLFYSREGEGCTAVDGRSGAPLGTIRFDVRYAGLGERGRVDARNLTPWRRPGGRRVWRYDRRTEMDGDASRVETVPFAPFGPCILAGDGLHSLTRDRGDQIYDLQRGRLYENVGFGFGRCWVLGDRWLVAGPVKPGRAPEPLHWRWRDPETGDEEPVPWLEPGESLTALLDDGRFLVRGDELVAVDPRTGVRTRLGMVAGAAFPEQVSRFRLEDVCYLTPFRTPDGVRILRIHAEGTGKAGVDDRWFTSLAPGATELTPPFRAAKVVGCRDERTLLAIAPDSDAILEVDIPTGRAAAIFSTR